jgi:hypothetical protein
VFLLFEGDFEIERSLGFRPSGALDWVEYFVSLDGSDISSREGSLGGGSF